MKLKDDFPLTEQLIYFDNSVMGLMPESTLKVIEGYTESLVHHMRGREKYRIYMGGFPGYENARNRAKEAFSKVIGAETGEVACVPNATTGVNTIFNMIPIESGDNIVATDLLYPMGAAAVYNQERRGAESRYIKGSQGIVETSAFEKAVDDDTKILYVDHAGWFNGILFDLPALSEIAHDHGAYLVVDATQSFGALDWQIDKTGVDFAATSTFKWLLGGIWSISAGFMYVNREHVDRFQPAYAGDMTWEKELIEDSTDGYTHYSFKPQRGAHRFEVYRGTDLSYLAVENSMNVLLDHGMNEIETQIKKLDTRMIDGLLERGYKLQSPVEEERRSFINVVVPDPRITSRKLREHDIAVSSRWGGLRVAPNFYNTIEEVDTFIEKLDQIS
jgi:selenocysteine lyase/cysteine desulfurase